MPAGDYSTATVAPSGQALAQALKDEARDRVRTGRFFGHIACASLIGRRPGG